MSFVQQISFSIGVIKMAFFNLFLILNFFDVSAEFGCFVPLLFLDISSLTYGLLL